MREFMVMPLLFIPTIIVAIVYAWRGGDGRLGSYRTRFYYITGLAISLASNFFGLWLMSSFFKTWISSMQSNTILIGSCAVVLSIVASVFFYPLVKRIFITKV